MSHPTMKKQTNWRNADEYVFMHQHLRLDDLKQTPGLKNDYIFREKPESPQPEFHVTHLKHDTEFEGLCGISTSGGFTDPCKRGGPDSVPLVWWSLALGPEQIQSAEKRLQKKTLTDPTAAQAKTPSGFLWKFATSPAFSETSRLGSYRFTFPLEEVLQAYSEQFCSGKKPIMRVYKTSLFKQEVQHAVLVHSPDNEELFSACPLLTDDPNAVCVYNDKDKDSYFIWRPEAVCETHRYQLGRTDGNEMEIQNRNHLYYVWDHVAIALHVENKQVLNFPVDELRKNLTYCWRDAAAYRCNRDQHFQDFEDANGWVQRLWPDCPAPLDEERSLQQTFAVSNLRLVLVGRTRAGKSSTGNTILGTRSFTKDPGSSSYGSSSATTRCWRESREVLDRVVTVVDTPGLSQTSSAAARKQISKCIPMSTPGPHAILLVIRMGPSTTGLQGLVKQMEQLFGEDVWRYTIILFTQSIQCELQEAEPELQEVLQKVENRSHVFNNDGDQVLGLLTKVEEMVAANGGHFDSN